MNSKINHSEKKVENSIVCYHFVWLYGLKGCMCVYACTNTYPHPHVHRTTLEVFAWKIITSGCHVEGTWGSRMKRRVIFYCRAFCTLWTFCFVHVITFSLKKKLFKNCFLSIRSYDRLYSAEKLCQPDPIKYYLSTYAYSIMHRITWCVYVIIVNCIIFMCLHI